MAHWSSQVLTSSDYASLFPSLRAPADHARRLVPGINPDLMNFVSKSE